jgi:hypothetical protein
VRKLKRRTFSRFKPAAPISEVDAPQRTQSLPTEDRGHYQQQLSVSMEISLDNLVHALPTEADVASRIPETEAHSAVEVQTADLGDEAHHAPVP